MKKLLGTMVLVCLMVTQAWGRTELVQVNHRAYMYLQDLSQEWRMSMDYDHERQMVRLSAAGQSMIFSPLTTWFWANGNMFQMTDPFLAYGGLMLVPASSESILKRALRWLQSNPDKAAMAKWGSQPAVAAKFASPHRIRRIMLDPGHGGKDSGALGVNGVKEKDLVLNVALRLKKILRANEFDVLVTRESDEFIPLWKRSQIANTTGVDLFVSLHANAAKNPQAQGLEVFYLSDEMDDYARAVAKKENAVVVMETDSEKRYKRLPGDTQLALWEMTYDEYRRESIKLSDYILNHMVKGTGLKKRGVKGARFYVIKNTLYPAVLVEMGFVTNRQDAHVLSHKPDIVAASIADGILHYAQEFERTKGFTI